MSDDLEFYKFKVKDFTPETMPFGRLVDYYSELKKMVGSPDNMHLIDIVEGSHANHFKIDRNHKSAVIKRLAAIQDGSAPKTALAARDSINQMLADDGTSGEFSDPFGRNVIRFPGLSRDTPALVRMHDAATFTGELYHIAGYESDVRVRIKTELYGVVYCTTTKDIAKALREFLFEQIKVSGRGMWSKNANGGWDIDDFSITDFLAVEKESLRGAVDRLRSLEIDWPKGSISRMRTIDEKSV